MTKGDVRRAKLYYLRERHGKAAKIKEHRSGSASDTRSRYKPGILKDAGFSHTCENLR